MPHACLCNTALASLAPAVCVPCCKPSLPSILPFFQPSLLPGMLAVPLCFVKSATPAKLGPPQRRTASQSMSPLGKPAAVTDSGGFTCQQGGWGARQLPLPEKIEPSGWPNVGSRVWVTIGRRARGVAPEWVSCSMLEQEAKGQAWHGAHAVGMHWHGEKEGSRTPRPWVRGSGSWQGGVAADAAHPQRRGRVTRGAWRAKWQCMHRLIVWGRCVGAGRGCAGHRCRLRLFSTAHRRRPGSSSRRSSPGRPGRRRTGTSGSRPARRSWT